MIWIRIKHDLEKRAPDAITPYKYKKGQIVALSGEVCYPGMPVRFDYQKPAEFALWEGFDIDLSPIFTVRDISEIFVNSDDPRLPHLAGVGVPVTQLEPGARPEQIS